VEHWDGTNWSIIPSPNPNPGVDRNSHLLGIAAISANDIWAVGDIGAPFGHISTLTEHWDGTSWSIIPCPNPGETSNRLFGVTALGDGTVAAVGHQLGTTTDQPLILQNAASAPKVPAAALAAPVTHRTTTLAPTRTLPAVLDAAPVDRFFAAAGKDEQRFSLARHRAKALATAGNGDLDALQGDIWLSDPT
jgi:hypothetical protein